jgi:hypothetical protein
MNREDGFSLNTSWNHLIPALKKCKKVFFQRIGLGLKTRI